MKALKDLRAAIDEPTDMWLEIKAAALGVDKQTVVRRVLREWAKEEAHAYKVATKRLQAHGVQMELYGEDAEDDGSSRSARR